MVEDPKFNNTILTNIGHQMLASIASGNRKLTYTKAEAYTQDVSSIANETLQALTSLQGKELSANLLVSNDNGNVVTITANFENKGLTNDVVFNSIGWFAKLDTDDAEHGITANQEYLIGITPANSAQTLVAPPADQSASQAISLNLNMTLSDASNVNMTVSDAGAVHFNQLDDQLAKYTTTADLTKLLAGKADLGLSYTKAEIDAKLLDLTTDTDGKVSADQVQALISDKANISDVYTKSQVDSALSTRDAQISDKANISDVYTKSQVDSALSTRDAEISTKANISDVYTKSDVDSALAVDHGRLGKLEGTQTLDSPDFNSITSTGVYYITNNTPANIKNNPSSQWGVLVVSNGNGNRTSQVYYPDDGSPQWCRLLNGSDWLPWYELSAKKDVSNAISLANKAQATANTKANASDVYTKTETDNQINKFDLSKVKFRKQFLNGDGHTADKTWSATKNDDGTYTIDLHNDDWTASKLHDVLEQLPSKANASDVYTKSEVDSKTSGTIITDYDIASKTPTKKTDRYNNKWLVDQNVLGQFADQINQLKGRRTVNQPDFNALTDGGSYYITDPSNGKNSPTGSWGNLFVSNGNGHRISQLYFPDDGSALFMRELDESTWHGWLQLATIDQVNNALNVANQANSALAAKANVTDVTKAQSTADSANANANGRLSVAGGNMNTTSVIQWNGGGIDDKNGNLGGITWNGGTDWAKIYGDQDDNDNLDLAFDLGDDGSNHFSFRQNGSETSAITSDGHFTGTVDWSRVNGRPEVTPVINGSTGDDLFAYKTNQLRLYPGNGLNCENLPPAQNKQWFTVQYVFENPNGDGVAIYRSPLPEMWISGNNGRIYGTWHKIATGDDITDLRNQIQQLRESQFEVQTFTDANAAANWEAQRPGHRLAIVNK